MKIIISPAKKMNIDVDTFEVSSAYFIDKTNIIKEKLQSLDENQLKKLWECNDSIAKLNINRLENMDLNSSLTPAVLAYEGLQYKHMSPSVFSETGLSYINEHLRILSGFYGILKPLDGVVPYRLEMQSKIEIGCSKDLYSFWGDSLARYLENESNIILNLASKEYSKPIKEYYNKQIVDIIFVENIKGKLVEKGTICKMLRGEMVRFLAENNITNIKEIKEFNSLDYFYSNNNSNSNQLMFIKGE